MSEGNLPNGAAARLEAVQDGKPWIKRFTKKEYAQAFAEYTARFGPLYEAPLAKPESLPALAEELLDGIAAGWQRQRPWNRTVALMNDKQMLVTYLSPMLQTLEGGAVLADLIRDGWAARWPKDAYQNGNFEELLGGFRSTFLGFEIFRKNKD